MKTKIIVHVLFLKFHHVEVLLENPIHAVTNNEDSSGSLYYRINRWTQPSEGWEVNQDGVKKHAFHALKNKAQERFYFEIDADPDEIVREWNQYHVDTKNSEHIFKDNCAVASQWFLSKYAQIPPPKYWAAPFGFNQVCYLLYCPSFVPLFALLPKRVFDNAKFHMELRKKQQIDETYLQINLSLAADALLISGSLFGIGLAANYLSKDNGRRFLTPILAYTAVKRTFSLFANINHLAGKMLLEVDETNATPHIGKL